MDSFGRLAFFARSRADPAQAAKPMTRWRNLWSVETGVFLTLFLVLMAIGPAALFRDPGTFWHIRVGERMLESAAIIRVDPFSFTFAGRPWIAYGWLADCLLALLHRIDGFDSTLLGTAAALAAFYAWLSARMSARGLQAPVVCLLLAMTIAASSYHFHPRPHLLSIFFTGWLFARLTDYDAGRLPYRRLFWILPLLVVWTNMHGGVLGGVAIIVVCAAAWTFGFGARSDHPAEREPWAGAFVLWSLFCVLALLVNPFGMELSRLWASLLGSPVVATLMAEHAPLDLSEASGKSVALLGLVYLAALAGVPWRRLRVTWLIPALWLVLAWGRIRHGPLFAVTAALAVAEMYGEIGWIRWATEHGSELLQPVARPRHAASMAPMLLPALLVASSLSLQVERVPFPLLGHGHVQFDSSIWPVDLLPDLEKYEVGHRPGTPIFNEMIYGGFLIYFTPGLGVFLDDRCELYGDEWLTEYSRAIAGDTEIFERWSRDYGFVIALTAPGSVLDGYLRGRATWRVVRESQSGTLFERRKD